MQCALLTVIFYSRIINHYGKCDAVRDVDKEARDAIVLDTTMCREMGYEALLCQKTTLWQSVLSDYLILSSYVCSNIVANIITNIYMYVMRHVRT